MATTFRYLGVSGFELRTDGGMRLLIDPYLEGNAARGFPSSPVRFDELLGSRVILVTHGAWDHLGEAIELCSQSGATLVCSPETAVHALGSGLNEQQVVKILQGCERDVDGAAIKALHAEHISFLYSEAQGQWLSGPPLSYLIVTDDGTRVFHSGDTALFGDLRLYGELYRPDVALLCVGATEPELAPLPPAEAALAADWLGAPVVIPMHYPTGSDSAIQFARELGLRRQDVRVVALRPGECHRHDPV